MSEETLFHEALAKSPADRAAFLDQACTGKPQLRAAIEALLAAHEASGSLLDAPPREATGAYTPEPSQMRTSDYQPPTEAGAVIAGRYTLVEKIGEGGMGEVWVAKQTEPVKRKVALKLIKAGMDSKAVLTRFEHERQALAMMDHPNIAKVLDGGLTPTRQPFFVMELVNGLALTKFCDDAKLGIRERLDLFVTICQAVQHAHQKGIVHRDLKPSNILVTLMDGKAIPKVIDFGVAKATGGKLTDESLSTQFGAVIGTLEYMSPEQAGFSAADIDTRADIYSLGVILYELLTGLRPFDGNRLRKAALDELIRIIREEEPSKPSTRLSTDEASPSLAALRQTEPGRLAKLLRGELDWVVMKCLEKQRDRRYETANALARDVQRYLADEAVEARPPSAGYRLGKFLKRNKGPVVAASLVLLALLVGMVGTAIGLVRAMKAEEVARTRFEEAEAARAKADASAQAEAVERKKAEKAEADTLADYRASTDDAIEQLIGSKPELGPKEKAYLENTLKRWQAFANRQGDDERSRAVRAEGHSRVGYLWAKLGRNEEARVEWQAARDLVKRLVEQFPAKPEYQQELAITHHSLGVMFRGLRKREEARAEFQAARDLLKRLVEQFPGVPAYQRDLTGNHYSLGLLLADFGKGEEARAEYEAARDIAKKLVEQFPAESAYQQELARTHNNLGALLAGLMKREEARAEIQAARETYQKLVEQLPGVPAYQQELARTHNNLGAVLAGLGQREKARAEYQAASEIFQKLVEQFPAMPAYQIDLGGNYCYYGLLIHKSGNSAKSLEWFDLAIQTLQPVHDKEPRDVTAKLFLWQGHRGRARAYDQLQKFGEAVKDWDRAIELSPPAERPGLRAGRASSQIQAGMVTEAIAEIAELTAPVADAPGSPKWDAGEWYDFACVYAVASGKIADKKQGYTDRAMELLQKAVQAGYKDAAHMKQDADLDPLRHRDDFKKLLAELEKKQVAKPENQP